MPRAKKNRTRSILHQHRFKLLFVLVFGLVFKLIIANTILSHSTLSQNHNNARVLSSHDAIGHSFTGFGIRGYWDLIGDIGVINTLKVMTKPVGEQQFAIHEYADFGCTAPNAWYVNDQEYMQVCIDAKARGENFVCGEDCPDERWTGAACGAGHRCCSPKVDGEKPSSPKVTSTPAEPKKSNLQGCVEGEGGLQFCSFNVAR